MFDASFIPQERHNGWRGLGAALDAHPVLTDRLKAFGTFSGIAVAAVAGFELIISGSFDSITPLPEMRAVAPSSYVTVFRVPWSSEEQIIPLSSTEPLFAGSFITVETPADRLAGGYDDPSAPEMSYPEVSEAEIAAQIEALYANDRAAYADAPVTYQEAPAIEEPAKETPDPFAEAEAMVEEALSGFDLDTAALQPS